MSDHNASDPYSKQKSTTLSKALSGQYQFNLKSLLTRSIEILKKNFSPMLQASIAVLAVVAAFMLLLINVYTTEEIQSLPAQSQGLMDIVLVLIMAPLSAGLAMLGIRAARGEKLHATDVFSFYPMILQLALAQLVVSLLVQFGLVLLIVPGIYVFIASTFTLPLIVEKKLPVLASLMLSVRVVNKYLHHFIVLFILYGVLFIVSAFTFGIGLLIVMPFYFVVMGVLYNDLFGSADNTGEVEKTDKESMFNA